MFIQKYISNLEKDAREYHSDPEPFLSKKGICVIAIWTAPWLIPIFIRLIFGYLIIFLKWFRGWGK